MHYNFKLKNVEIANAIEQFATELLRLRKLYHGRICNQKRTD